MADVEISVGQDKIPIGCWERGKTGSKKTEIVDGLDAVRTDSKDAIGSSGDFYCDFDAETIDEIRHSGKKITEAVAEQRERPALFIHFLAFHQYNKIKAPTLSYMINNNNNLSENKSSYLINTVEQMLRLEGDDSFYDNDDDEELLDD